MILPEGTKVRMKEDCVVYRSFVWGKGDIATLTREVNTEQAVTILLDFKNQGNLTVEGDGRWFATLEDFEVIDA